MDTVYKLLLELFIISTMFQLFYLLLFMFSVCKSKDVTFNKEKKKFEETLTKINVPVQIIWGEEDKVRLTLWE